MTAEVLFEKRGHIALFTLNRPKKKNAVNQAVSELMAKHLAEFEAATVPQLSASKTA